MNRKTVTVAEGRNVNAQMDAQTAGQPGRDAVAQHGAQVSCAQPVDGKVKDARAMDGKARFMALVDAAIEDRTFGRLVLSRPSRPMLPPGFVDEGPVLQRVRIRPVRLRDGVKLAFGWQYDTRDQTDNLALQEARDRIESLLGDMRTALLETSALTAELGFGKRGTPLFRMKRRADAGRDTENTTDAVGAGHWQQGTGALSRLRAVESRAAQPGDTARDAAGHLPDAGLETRHMGTADTVPDDGWGALATQNRRRQYPVGIERPFLRDLGLVGRGGQLVPAMARKWRQINRFVEIVARAWARTALQGQVGGAGQRPLRIRDYGAGKGYLTFALHDYLTHTLGLQVETVGVERRADLVALCNRLARNNGLQGLRFEKGDILRPEEVMRPGEPMHVGKPVHPAEPARSGKATGSGEPGSDVARTADAAAHGSGQASRQEGSGQDAADIVIALHACDTATDDALWQGIRQQTAMLVCSPCCHRELRPQLKAPEPLTALLRHGIHLGQEAEMLTDGLRALLLETQGYEAQVFEFISPEDTGKNKMILGCRTGRSRPVAEVRAEIDALKAFYGIEHQRLDALLRTSGG